MSKSQFESARESYLKSLSSLDINGDKFIERKENLNSKIASALYLQSKIKSPLTNSKEDQNRAESFYSTLLK
jgi:hypothetical protein